MKRHDDSTEKIHERACVKVREKVGILFLPRVSAGKNHLPNTTCNFDNLTLYRSFKRRKRTPRTLIALPHTRVITCEFSAIVASQLSIHFIKLFYESKNMKVAVQLCRSDRSAARQYLALISFSIMSSYCEETDFAEYHYYKINRLLLSTFKLWPYRRSRFAIINHIINWTLLVSLVFFQVLFLYRFNRAVLD